MTKTLGILLLSMVFSSFVASQGAKPEPAGAPSANAGEPAAAAPHTKAEQTPASAQDLKAVLAEMNTAAKTFKSAQADFEWDQYQRVVEEHDVQKGQIYFKRTRSGIDAAVKVVSPEPKQVLFKDGKLSLYQPKINQVTEYKASSNRADVESFMSLGFGASGDDLARNFEMKLDGWETVDGVRTARLVLVPKKQKVKSSLERVLLWLDPQRNVSLKQQFFEPSGDYRLTHYTNIRLNGKISDDVFRLKTTASTNVVTPQ